jgi:hypothetical protein
VEGVSGGWRKLRGDEPEVREVGGAFETLQKNEKYVSNICLTI